MVTLQDPSVAALLQRAARLYDALLVALSGRGRHRDVLLGSRQALLRRGGQGERRGEKQRNTLHRLIIGLERLMDIEFSGMGSLSMRRARTPFDRLDEFRIDERPLGAGVKVSPYLSPDRFP